MEPPGLFRGRGEHPKVRGRLGQPGAVLRGCRFWGAALSRGTRSLWHTLGSACMVSTLQPLSWSGPGGASARMKHALALSAPLVV